METLKTLTKVLTNLFPNDKSAPSVITAWLEDRQSYYVSLVRYVEEFGQGKMVICKTMCDCPENGYKILVKQLSELVPGTKLKEVNENEQNIINS